MCNVCKKKRTQRLEIPSVANFQRLKNLIVGGERAGLAWLLIKGQASWPMSLSGQAELRPVSGWTGPPSLVYTSRSLYLEIVT